MKLTIYELERKKRWGIKKLKMNEIKKNF
jgi:hypothetical protein